MHDIDRVRLEAESEAFEAEQFEFSGTGEIFGETETMELASELLEVSSESELEQFLGDLVAKAGQALGRFAGSPSGQALVGVLKGAAKQVLPTLGSSVGQYFGGATGAKLGAQAADAAARAFGLEMEGMSGEDREFEIARRYINLAGEAVRNLAENPAAGDPRQAAREALIAAAHLHAPGLAHLPARPGPTIAHDGRGAAEGRWERLGADIILYEA
jgi:hypothetical protein